MVIAKPELRTGVRMSLDEFLALGETDERIELDRGVIYVMSSASPDHQFILVRWCIHTEGYLDGFAEPPAVLYPDITTVLSPEQQQAPRPDLVIILRRRAGIVGRYRVEGAPDIVLEILSTDRDYDLVRKRQMYAEAGVLEYWICDPRNDTVILLELRDGEYVERAILTAADTLTTPLLPGLAIPLGDVFNHPRRPPRDE